MVRSQEVAYDRRQKQLRSKVMVTLMGGEGGGGGGGRRDSGRTVGYGWGAAYSGGWGTVGAHDRLKCGA